MKRFKKFASNISKKANAIRSDVIRIAVGNGAGHIASSLSSVDILVALYYGGMSYDPNRPLWEGRDRLIFSKAHGCYGLYAILADKGILPKKEWERFYCDESTLCGCADRRLEYGIEAGCGSLGHGLPIAVGLAFGAKLQKKRYFVFCVVGDGELQEGTTWEALQFAVKHELKNLIVIVDRNYLQAMDLVINVLDRTKGDVVRRPKGFGLSPVSCPGHDAAKIQACITAAKNMQKNTPKVIIANTVKGYGLNCMQGVPKFHFRIPTDDELAMGKSYE